MSESPKVRKTTKQPAASTPHKVTNPALLLTVTALDTTWRIFLPVLLGTIGGIMLDHTWSIVPVMTIVLTAAGTAVAAWLIYRQLKAVR